MRAKTFFAWGTYITQWSNNFMRPWYQCGRLIILVRRRIFTSAKQKNLFVQSLKRRRLCGDKILLGSRSALFERSLQSNLPICYSTVETGFFQLPRCSFMGFFSCQLGITTSSLKKCLDSINAAFDAQRGVSTRINSHGCEKTPGKMHLMIFRQSKCIGLGTQLRVWRTKRCLHQDSA